jgi:hypothetical protein
MLVNFFILQKINKIHFAKNALNIYYGNKDELKWGSINDKRKNF